MSSPNINDIDNTQFYRVLFSHIANLIKKRNVFVMQGEAFVPEQEMAFVFVSHFKRILISSFEVSMNVMKVMIIENLKNRYRFSILSLHTRLHVKLEPICTMMKGSILSLPI